MKYSIVRYFRDRSDMNVVLVEGLTLEEAKKRCSDPETSSNTCTLPQMKQLTKLHGPWFDGYKEEST